LEALRQEAVADAGDGVGDLAEPAAPRHQGPDDGARPAPADDLHGPLEAGAVSGDRADVHHVPQLTGNKRPTKGLVRAFNPFRQTERNVPTMTIATSTHSIEAHEVPAAGNWNIDRSHTSVEFVARHLMIAKVRGRFTDVAGTIEIGDAPEQSSAHVTIQAASISTGDEARDAHLRSPDFLDVERFPTLE